MMRTSPGSAITFYSYKGGVGRSFALVSIAVVMASWGKKVLCVDWDLEAPGLTHYFGDRIARPRSGVLDFVESASAASPAAWKPMVERADLPVSGFVDVFAAGGGDSYAQRLTELDWGELYLEHGLGDVVEQFRREALAEYDYVLIDSRTGLTDIGGICAAQLPDILVMVLTPNNQSLRGTLDIAQRAATARDAMPYDRAGLLTLPILSRFDAREERQLAVSWKSRLGEELRPLYDAWLPKGIRPIDVLDQTTIPYVSYWSFGEGIPTLDDSERSTDPESIRYSLEAIAGLLATELADADRLITSRHDYLDDVRTPDSARRLRPGPRTGEAVFLSYHRSDSTEVAERLHARLRSALPNSVVGAFDKNMAPGEDLRQHLIRRVEQSAVALVLIGPAWGAAMMDSADDWVRLEIEYAFAAGLHVIPVLVDGASMPGPTELPGSLSQLTFIVAAELRSDRFDEDFARLIAAIRRVLDVPMVDAKRGVLDRILQWFRGRLGDASSQTAPRQ